MADSGGALSCTVRLPLYLHSKKKDDQQHIQREGIQKVATHLKQYRHTFQQYLRSQHFWFVEIKDVSFECSLIYITFEFKGDYSLNGFYKCTSSPENDLSRCISKYFDDHSLYYSFAGLPFGSQLTCTLQMTRKQHLMAQYDICSEDVPSKESHTKSEEDATGKLKENAHARIKKNPTDSVEAPQSSGSYSYSQTDANKSLTGNHEENKHAGTQNPVIKKQFILYYPHVAKGHKLENVAIESKTCTVLNKKMSSYYSNLYETSIDIPMKLLERGAMSFHYVATWKEKGFVYDSRDNDTSYIVYVDSSSCQRSVWINSKTKQNEKSCGYLEHLQDMLFSRPDKRSKVICLKEKCIDIESLCTTGFTKESAVTILKGLAQELRTANYPPDSSLLFLAAAGKVLTRPELIVNDKLVGVTEALDILKSVQMLKISSLPTSSHRCVQNVCLQLCKLGIGDKHCTLSYLSLCYPFYGESHVLEKIKEYVSSRVTICPDSESMFPFADDLCANLYRAVVSGSQDTAKSSLEILLRRLPLQIALHVYAKLCRTSANQSTTEVDLHNVLYGSISSQIESMLVATMKSSNLRTLLNSWREIDKLEMLNEKFRSKYEDAVITILGSHSTFMEPVSEHVCALVDNSGFFREPSKQYKLIQVIVKSQNEKIRNLFISLASCAGTAEWYMQLEKDQFRDLCICFVVGTSSYMRREQAFTYVCQRLNDIWCIPQMDRRPDLQEIWKNILSEELKKYGIQELFKMLKTIDRLSGDNEQVGLSFIEYVRSTIEAKHDSFRPKDIFRWLPGTSVNSRLSALLLNVVIDTYGNLLPHQSIFTNIIQLAKHYDFWQSFYSCKGSHLEIVTNNKNGDEARKCISTMVQLFRNNEVSYDFVVDIENNAQLCSATKALLQLECNRRDIDQFWSEALNKFKEEKEKLQRVHQVVSIVKSKVSIGSLQEGFTNIINHTSTLEMRLTSGKVTAKECIKNNLIWRDFEQLPIICKHIEALVPSIVFWNICSNDVLEDFQVNSTEVNDDDDEPLLSVCESTNKAMHFLNMLSTNGMDLYIETWRDFLVNEEFRMNDVLMMFGKRPNIADEIQIARKIVLSDISTPVVDTLERVYGIDKVKTTVHAVIAVLRAFKLDISSDISFSSAVDSFNKLKKGAATDYTFRDVRIALDTVFSSIKDLTENTINIMEELGKSTSLIEFLRVIVDEDIRNLIDAVEDISEQQVRESTVSALIEVKRYIHQLLIPTPDRTCQDLIHILETRSVSGNPVNLPAKIADCMGHLHNLKSLYNNVANRGEQTKEMIRNIVQKGTFFFKLDKDGDDIDFEVQYEQNKNIETRQRSTLVDLRSRALLLMNTERKDIGESHSQPEDLSMFVTHINVCLDIADALLELYSSGHVEYMTVRTKVKPKDLQATTEGLNDILTHWIHTLQLERQCHFLMNFIHGTQIHVLYEYLEGDDKDVSTVLTMLKFIHPQVQIKSLRDIYEKQKRKCETSNEEAMLNCIGCTLHIAFEDLVIFERPISMDLKGVSKKITDRVQTSKLLVAQLEDGSIHTVKTVLGLFSNTTQRLPEPNQLLFCTRTTTWNEIDLLIGRCMGAEKYYNTTPLFCVANVELLPNEIQFHLVDALRHLDRSVIYLLALVCRGSRNHPFIDELNEYVTSVSPATDRNVRCIFQEHCVDVLTITSDEAGQGKSCLLHRLAHERKKGIVTLHISGQIRKSTLVERLLSLNIKDCHILHIDIGSVDDPTELDTFLFELVVLRYVSAGRVFFCLKTYDVKIEIANTINDTLRNALQTAVLFTRQNIKWQGIDIVVISKDVNSPTQIVCRYLDLLEKKRLDKDDLTASANIPLSRVRCRYLLQKYIRDTFCSSFPVLHTFLGVLADQLKKLSQSSFFRVARLRDMVGSKSPVAIKSKLVNAMIDMSKEFAKRSVDECREAQLSTLKPNSEVEGVERMDLESSVLTHTTGMIRWEESNHLIFVFHNQNIQTLSALYRNLDKVEREVKFLFESQMKKEMADFTKMNQTELQTMLQKVARTNPLPLPDEQLVKLAKGYALTADNLLKMVLIMLRIKANVPVIVMGETGCGKTSLIRYLADICEAKFDVMNIHAGIVTDEIVAKVISANELALENEGERWLFLDEINTSESICMIGDIISHHTCLGKELSPNLVVMGACNPYRLRSSHAISSAGLDSKVKTDELSRLVYRVLPLPEMLVDYVWDFGSLNEKDEDQYIFRITDDILPGEHSLHQLFTSLLSASQSFVREKEASAYSVSLRDVQRCKMLTRWFMDVLVRKVSTKDRVADVCELPIKAMILSLAHCYHSRFSDKLLRKQYRQAMSKVFDLHGFTFDKGHGDFILRVIRDEQKDILGRMEIPPGTACNTALQENVFVILVCIFNRIPIFVVGKPGCSKSLAMQLIRSNLRGKDSKDEFFKTLPQLYCVSFQGSESSTSDGIFKVFEKAENYQISNRREDVLSVVILDEIGLAEVSRFNPLKVLHNLLEPDGNSQPNVAVVGISNWALDASKMNRAIHLSRTDMDVEELFETAMSISESFLEIEVSKSETLFGDVGSECSVSTKDIETELHGMAEAYCRYIEQMRFKNFHGLRDYYSLVKYVARMFAETGRKLDDADKAQLIVSGLERNFGGLPSERQTLYDVFRKYITMTPSTKHAVIDLVTQNIQDPIARHLMLITTGDSALGIVEQTLHDMGCHRKEVIFGSQFEEDLTDDYNYRILSRIILCMEEGVVLILKDLESIYGSLYDMLNQNYTVIGKKKNCRVALGPYSNPICHVAESFRCIVLTNETKLDLSDPPFLNRFEKQYLRICDIIKDSQKSIIDEIETWIDYIAGTGTHRLKKHEIFPIYNEDMVASLVLKHDIDRNTKPSFPLEHSIRKTTEREQAMLDFKRALLWVIKPEVIVRLQSANCQTEENNIVSEYFLLPVHGGLNNLISYHMNTTDDGLMSVIFTNSNVHTKLSRLLPERQVQVEKVGAFKSEKQLSSKMKLFWERDDCDILIVQCNAKEDEKHIMLTKLVIERHRRDYRLKDMALQKHVYMVVHLDRSNGMAHCFPQLNFLTGWQLIMLDSVECPRLALPELCRLTLHEAVQEKRPLYSYLKDELFWAFTRIKYCLQSRDVESLSKVITKMENSAEFLELLENEIWSWIVSHKSGDQDRNWQIKVAMDVTLLNTASSFVSALEQYVLSVIKMPLSKYIYKIELSGILESFFPSYPSYTSPALELANMTEKRQSWISLLRDRDVFSIDDIPDETGPECYTCDTSDLSLTMPFSLFIYEHIEETREEFMQTVRTYRSQCLLEDVEDIPMEIYEEVLHQQENFVLQKVPYLKTFLYKQWGHDYLDDFCNISSYRICHSMHRDERTNYAKLILMQSVELAHEDPFAFLIRLHTAVWVHFASFRAELLLIEACLKVVPGIETEIHEILSHKRQTKDKEHPVPKVEVHSENVQNIAKDYSDLADDIAGHMLPKYMPAGEDEKTDEMSVDREYDNETPVEEMDIELSVQEDNISENNTDTTENNSYSTKLADENTLADSTDVSDSKDVLLDAFVTSPNFGKHMSSPLDNRETEGASTIMSECREELQAGIELLATYEELKCDNDDSYIHRDEDHDSIVNVGHSESKLRNCDEDLLPNDWLVQVLCQKMLPTTACLQHHGGIQSWQSKVMSALSLAYQVSRTPNLLYSLRVCCEVANEFIAPCKVECQQLENLGNIIYNGYSLDSEDVFQAINIVVRSTLHTGCSLEQEISCMRMLSSYFVMCISAEPDTSVLDFMFSLTLSSNIPNECFSLFKAPLCLSFSLIERDMFISILMTDNIYKSDVDESESNSNDTCGLHEIRLFWRLDQTITSLFDKQDGGHHFIVLLVDLFQDIYVDDLSVGEPDENETSEMLTGDCVINGFVANEIFLACHKVLIERIYGIRYVAALAFFKAFVSCTVHQLHLLDHEKYMQLTNCLDVVLADERDPLLKQSLTTYFLKLYQQDRTPCRLQKFYISNNDDFKFLKCDTWSGAFQKRCFENSPLCIYQSEKTHAGPFKCMSDMDYNTYKSGIETIVSDAQISVDGLISMFSLILKEFYLYRITAPLDDAKRTKAAILANEVIEQKIDDELLLFLLKCLAGEEDFYFDQFHLTEECTDKHFCKVSFFVSLYAVGMSHVKFQKREHASVFMQCLGFPEYLKTCIFPGFPDTKIKQIFQTPLHSTDVEFADCCCGHLLAFYCLDRNCNCIVCSKAVNRKKLEGDELHLDLPPCGSLSLEISSHPFATVRGLHPVSCHILQLMTKVCLLGSAALSPSTLEEIGELIDVPDIDVRHVLWQNIGDQWDKLCELLNIDDYLLFVLFQTIVSQSLDMLFNTKAPATAEDAVSWEKCFDCIICKVLKYRYTNMQMTVLKHDRLHGVEDTLMELSIQELGDLNDVPVEKRNDLLLPLYRVTGVASKANFLSELYHRRNEFPLLTLVLENEEDLKLPQHALNIVNWHMATIANANYIIKKDECLKMSVQDFISFKQDKDRAKSTIIWDRFEAFRESWEYLKEHLEIVELVSKMTHIHSESKMSECLILDTTSIMYRVLRKLLDIQNSFIYKVLQIADRCAALKFLFRDVNIAVIPRIQVADVKREELIICSCNWDEILRQESQCDLTYGHGRYINYDFNTIEQSIAVDILSGKSNIQMTEALPKIVFIDELHKNYSSMMRDLKSSIVQEPLPPAIAHGIHTRNDDDPRMATELLTHLGIVMALMKKTKGDPELPLVEYVDGWKSLLSRRFPRNLLPSPETSLKLCHVVALSELLEEICADYVRHGLGDEFRCKLEAPLKAHILKTLQDEVMATAFLKAAKRFTYRCLSSKVADANQSLRGYLSDESFWPTGCLVDCCLTFSGKIVKLSDAVPDGLMVRHIFACLTTIEAELEKRRQSSMEMTAFATSFQAKVKSNPTTKTKENKRRATTFRRF